MSMVSSINCFSNPHAVHMPLQDSAGISPFEKGGYRGIFKTTHVVHSLNPLPRNALLNFAGATPDSKSKESLSQASAWPFLGGLALLGVGLLRLLPSAPPPILLQTFRITILDILKTGDKTAYDILVALESHPEVVKVMTYYNIKTQPRPGTVFPVLQDMLEKEEIYRVRREVKTNYGPVSRSHYSLHPPSDGGLLVKDVKEALAEKLTKQAPKPQPEKSRRPGWTDWLPNLFPKPVPA